MWEKKVAFLCTKNVRTLILPVICWFYDLIRFTDDWGRLCLCAGTDCMSLCIRVRGLCAIASKLHNNEQQQHLDFPINNSISNNKNSIRSSNNTGNRHTANSIGNNFGSVALQTCIVNFIMMSRFLTLLPPSSSSSISSSFPSSSATTSFSSSSKGVNVYFW